MIYKNFFSNKLLTKLSESLCNRCFVRCMSWEKKSKRERIGVMGPHNRKAYTRQIETYFTIRDPKIVDIVAKHVTSDLPENSVIFESCPGSGVLTKKLLRSCVESVRVFESNPSFLKDLEELKKRKGKRLQIITKQILNFQKFLNKYLKDFESETKEWFKDIPINDWVSPPAIRFFAVLSPQNYHFLRFIMKLMPRKELFFSYGRTEFFVFVSENEFNKISAKPALNFLEYRSATVLYNTLFDIQTLETFPYSCFERYSDLPEAEDKKEVTGNAILIRLTPKPFLSEFNTQTLQDYYFFVNQTFMKRKNYVIPFLENWFPGCGPDLIKKGIPVFKYFGDLRPEEVLDLFLYFKDRPDYDNSVYKAFAMRDIYDLIDVEVKDVEEDIDIKDHLELNDITHS